MNNNYEDRAGKQLNFFLREEYTAFIVFVNSFFWNLNVYFSWNRFMDE